VGNTDSFIQEVTEEVRRDRLFALMRRWAWAPALAVILLVGGAAWYEWRRAEARDAARAFGDALQAALAEADPGARAAALAAIPAPGAAAAPKALLEAAALAEAGETAAAAERLAGIAADPGLSRVWRDLAALRRLMILGAALAPAERLAALAPLTVPGAPFRPLALELEAYTRLEAGERAAARALLEQLVADQQATEALRLRAGQVMVALSGPDGG
jgi:hypothetical protein